TIRPRLGERGRERSTIEARRQLFELVVANDIAHARHELSRDRTHLGEERSCQRAVMRVGRAYRQPELAPREGATSDGDREGVAEKERLDRIRIACQSERERTGDRTEPERSSPLCSRTEEARTADRAEQFDARRTRRDRAKHVLEPTRDEP